MWGLKNSVDSLPEREWQEPPTADFDQIFEPFTFVVDGCYLGVW